MKSSDAREIARLKKELATCRAVIRSYVLEIDSLNRLNQNLTAENTRVKGQYEEATRQIEGLNSDKASLSEKVAIAAQLDATGITMGAKKKNGAKKNVKKIKDAKLITVGFTITRNVTAQNGKRQLYVRITTPAGGVMGASGSFKYEKPFAAIHHGEDHRIYRQRDSGDYVLERERDSQPRHIQCERIRRRQPHRTAQLHIQIMSRQVDTRYE